MVIMSKINPMCRVCGIALNDDNWAPSRKKGNRRICRSCSREYLREWHKAHPTKRSEYSRRERTKHPEIIKERTKQYYKKNSEKMKEQYRKQRHIDGQRLYHENRECASFLGVHVAERVLSHVFKDVERMPMHNPGFDFVCNKGKKIDVKSSCQRKDGRWDFHISRNTIADYFLCIAFDNRRDLNPLNVWLFPGAMINHLMNASVSISTVDKWDNYKLDVSKVNNCCDAIREMASPRETPIGAGVLPA